MAFIGLFFVSVIAIVAVFIFGTAMIIGGTILYKKTNHKKIGFAMKILGYLIVIPLVFIVSIFIISLFI